MSKLSDRIIQVLIRKDISIHAQLFRFMSLLGTIAMAVGGVYTLAEPYILAHYYLPCGFLLACFSGQERNSSNMISVLSF